jgi:Spy/CpxP family protein refolding chaperone
MKMKKSILLIIALLLLGISGMALATGNNKGPAVPRRPGRSVQQPMQRRQSAFDKLNLTEKQKSKIKEIRKDFAIKAERIRKSNLSDKQKQERLANLNKDMQSKINSVLTPKQREIRAAAIKQAGERRSRHNGGTDATIIRFRKELKLSDKQIKQIEKINNESKQRIMQVLTAEQRRKLEQIKKDAGPRAERERKQTY